MSSRRAHTLLADVGATNARFSLLANGALGTLASFEVARHAQFPDAVTAFLNQYGGAGQVTDALIAVAGPVEQGRCALTNCSWMIDAQELRTTFGLAEARIVNDFEATALSLSHLADSDLYPLGGGQAVSGAPMAVLGPGTGLGVACLIPGSPTPVVVAGDAGSHVFSFQGTTDTNQAGTFPSLLLCSEAAESAADGLGGVSPGSTSIDQRSALRFA